MPPAPGAGRKRIPTFAIVLIVVFCLVAACTVALAVSGVRGAAKTRQTVTLAEAHYEKASQVLAAASDDVSAYADTTDASSATAADEKIRTARDELAAATVAIEGLSDSDGKKDYLASLESARTALEGVQRMLGTLRVLSELGDQVGRGSAEVRAADKLLDASIDAANRKNYATMRSKAYEASKRYERALEIFKSADETEPSAGLSTLIGYLKLRQQQADLSVKMADHGKAGRVSAYNTLVKKQRALDAKAKKVGEPAIVKDDDWFESQVSQDTKLIEDAGQKADTLRAQALEEFGL